MTHFCLSGAGTESFPWQIEPPNSVLPRLRRLISQPCIRYKSTHRMVQGSQKNERELFYQQTNKPRTKALLSTKRKSISYLQAVSCTFAPRTSILLQVFDLHWETLQGQGPAAGSEASCVLQTQAELTMSWLCGLDQLFRFHFRKLQRRHECTGATAHTGHRTPRCYLKATEGEGSSWTPLSFQW